MAKVSKDLFLSMKKKHDFVMISLTYMYLNSTGHVTTSTRVYVSNRCLNVYRLCFLAIKPRTTVSEYRVSYCI